MRTSLRSPGRIKFQPIRESPSLSLRQRGLVIKRRLGGADRAKKKDNSMARWPNWARIEHKAAAAKARGTNSASALTTDYDVLEIMDRTADDGGHVEKLGPYSSHIALGDEGDSVFVMLRSQVAAWL
jgi:hypothetical protein